MVLVSMSPRFCVLCAIFVALLGLVWVRARKSSPSALKTPQIRRFCAVLGEFFRGNATGGAALGEFLRAVGLAAGRRRPYSTRWVNVRINGFG